VSALLGAAATPGSDAEWLRGVALYALGLLGDARAVAPLVEALESGQIGEHGLGENERVYLVDALGRLGDDADLGVAPQLEKRLRDRGRKRTSVDVARALPTALARLAAGAEPAAQKRIVAALVDAVDSDRDASVVNQATIALGRIAASPDVSPAARGRAKKALLHEWRRRKRDPAPFVALALAIAAKGPDGAELVAPLREALKTADDADSLAATVLALGLVRDNESVDALLGLLRDRGAGPLLRSCAAESIALIGDDRDVTRFGLNQALIGAQDDLAVRITSALVARGDQDALDASLTQIESGHGDQAWLDHLAGTLGRHGGDAEARRLAAVVSDPGQRHSDLTRGMAARALGRMGLSSDARTRIAEDFPYGVYSPVLWAYMGWY
jgi:HEAT repeat protein